MALFDNFVKRDLEVTTCGLKVGAALTIEPPVRLILGQ